MAGSPMESCLTIALPGSGILGADQILVAGHLRNFSVGHLYVTRLHHSPQFFLSYEVLQAGRWLAVLETLPGLFQSPRELLQGTWLIQGFENSPTYQGFLGEAFG